MAGGERGNGRGGEEEGEGGRKWMFIMFRFQHNEGRTVSEIVIWGAPLGNKQK